MISETPVPKREIIVYTTYRYRLYRCDRKDKLLHQQINLAGLIWNHALALQKRYYRMTRKYIPLGKLYNHFSHLRMRTKRFGYWRALGSQAAQDILQRLDTAYQRYFQGLAKRPPKFKRVKSYTSFKLKQTGWKLLPDRNSPVPKGKGFQRGVGLIEISGKRHKYVKHRPIEGVVKSVTIKRDSGNRLWISFSVAQSVVDKPEPTTGRAAGFDFGLKTFLTDDTGKSYLNPLFFKMYLRRIQQFNRVVSRKLTGSHNHKRARYLLNRTHLRIADKRRDYHYRLAHWLCCEFDILFLETLHLDAMKRLWGRKVSDLGFAQFVDILQQVAFKQGKQVLFIPPFERTTGKCSGCGHYQKLELRQRIFACEVCGLVLDRDHNAARNIYHVGSSTYTGLGIVRPSSDGSPV